MEWKASLFPSNSTTNVLTWYNHHLTISVAPGSGDFLAGFLSSGYTVLKSRNWVPVTSVDQAKRMSQIGDRIYLFWIGELGHHSPGSCWTGATTLHSVVARSMLSCHMMGSTLHLLFKSSFRKKDSPSGHQSYCILSRNTYLHSITFPCLITGRSQIFHTCMPHVVWTALGEDRRPPQHLLM